MAATDPRSVPTLVVTVSDRSASGSRPDRSGPRLVELLTQAGHRVDGPLVIPDGADSVAAALREAVAEGYRLVVTTGGTGVGPRDYTPEGTRQVLTRELDGVAEQLRREGAAHTPMAAISRGTAGVIDPAEGTGGGTLVVNLPGSVRAVEQNLPALLPLVPHLLVQLDTGDHG
ncbi:MogA/MoaB family molybdenum cofactor biosynthesis protein [Ornithinicoccus halotolerans]|uniref:MogA/MoaB family molybdenum cofactor biosynthesis protein n=1 Tax=Ornithinicoccus halotolerans TaxID=1748220 RepID=UPI001296451F|nr:molybdopterin-binding protein [Ornithinicoccus halotolerans]